MLLYFAPSHRNPFVNVPWHGVPLQDGPVEVSWQAFFEHFKGSMCVLLLSGPYVESFKGSDIFVDFIVLHFKFGEFGVCLFDRCGVREREIERLFPFLPDSFVHFQVYVIVYFGGCLIHLLGYPIIDARTFDV